ncbi:MAG: serine hydrolase domain-containing protein [Protaetiibacter sp.]
MSAGLVAAGFEPVAEAFDATIADCGGLGAALSVRVGGRTVVDRWGGVMDARTGEPWSDRTLSVIFSATKGLLSIMAAQLVADGRLDYGAPVTRYWPGLGARLHPVPTVGDLLAHRAGLSAPREDLTLEQLLDWDGMIRVLETQDPLWAPGSAHAYHAITFGWVVGELIRRVTAKPLGEAFRAMIADPLHAEAWIGLPPAEDARVARLDAKPVPAAAPTASTPQGAEWEERAMTMGGALPPRLIDGDAGFTDPRLWHAEIGGAGGIATAHALATIWSATVIETDGVRLLGDEVLGDATMLRSTGTQAFGSPSPHSWGAGFMVPAGTSQYLGPRSFGHDGAGGQIAFADAAHRVGFAYLTNWMGDDADVRGTAVVEALRTVLAARTPPQPGVEEPAP